MKTFQLMLLLSIAAMSTSFAQTAEEILAKYTEATGGQENWDKIQSMRVTGTAKLVLQGMELPFTRIRLKSGQQITSLKVNGMDYIDTAFDGTMVWGTNSQMQRQEKDSDTAENIKRAGKEFPYPAHNWKQNGFTVEYLGEVTIEGQKTYKIKLIKEPVLVEGEEVENSMIYYFDAEKYVPILTESEATSGPQKGQITKSYLSDYREVNGYLYPFLSTMKIRGETFQILETTKVEFNVKIEESIFKM